MTLERSPRLDLAVGLGAAAFSGLMLWVMRDVVNDNAYITYRYAQNLALGRGFVFNPGEAVLGTTAPLHGLLLGLLGTIHADIALNALFVGYAACVALAFFAYRALAGAGLPFGGIVAALLLLSSSSTYDHVPLETLLVAALLVAALVFAQERRFPALCVALALAVLVRADSALFSLVLFGWIARSADDRRLLLRSAPLFLFPLLAWACFAWVTYGSPLPNSASTKSGWSGHALTFVGSLWERGLASLLSEPWLSLLGTPFVVAGAAFSFRREHRRVLPVLVSFWFCYVAVYTALRIFWPHTWYYYPLHVVHCLLFGLGFERAVRAGQWAVVRPKAGSELATVIRPRISPRSISAFAVTLVAGLVALGASGVWSDALDIPSAFFAGGRDALYRAAAGWLRQNPKRCARIASLEVGTLAYHSDRVFIDRMGLVTPRAGAEMKRTQQREVGLLWTIREFQPDCLIFAGGGGPWPERVPSAPDYCERAPGSAARR